MGLLRSCFDVIGQHIAGADVLMLGYQDLVLSPQEAQALGIAVETHPQTGYPETCAAFAQLGAKSLRIVDRARIRGYEEIGDLNVPVELGSFDLVLDSGTTEHCFCPGTALLNVAAAVKVGGRIFHTPPLSMLNHGFYNICPTLYHDFYTQNGWTVERLVGMRKKGNGAAFEIPPVEKFDAERGSVMHCLARRINAEPLRIPVQSKYA